MTTEVEQKAYYEWEAAAYWATERRCHDAPDATRTAQQEITGWSFAGIRAIRPSVQAFRGLLTLFPGQDGEPDDIAPDHTVFAHHEPVAVTSHFLTFNQTARPTLVLYSADDHLESRFNREIEKCERGLRVPYCLVFHRHAGDLLLLRLGKTKYLTVKPNDAGRLAIPELELEAAILDGWVRFWFRGELVPLPGDLIRERTARLAAEAELARLREELARLKGAS